MNKNSNFFEIDKKNTVTQPKDFSIKISRLDPRVVYSTVYV